MAGAIVSSRDRFGAVTYWWGLLVVDFGMACVWDHC